MISHHKKEAGRQFATPIRLAMERLVGTGITDSPDCE
jgi:hypothetical protein